MTANSLPILGAALPVDALPHYRDWLLEHQRDLELQTFFSAEVLDGDWHPLVAEARRHLDGHTGRLGIHGPFWGFAIASHDAEIRKVVARRMQQGLDVCAAVGANQMVIHSPYTTWDYNNLDDNPGAREQLIERCHMTLGAAVKRAEDMGCTLVLENIEDKDPYARVALARSFDSAAVRVSIDTGHAHYAHGSTGAPPVDFYVAAAGDMLEHVHLQDTDGYADRHWPPGEGTIRWAGFFKAITRLGSNPRLVLEIKDKNRVLDGARYLVDHGLAL